MGINQITSVLIRFRVQFNLISMEIKDFMLILQMLDWPFIITSVVFTAMVIYIILYINLKLSFLNILFNIKLICNTKMNM